jgi:hypothetical protein
MRVRTVFLAILVGAFAAGLSAETWKNVSLIDSQCVDKAKADPDKHTKKCALACEDGGYGILTAEGKYLKFDAAGNEKAAKALEATQKTDHLRATVEGTVSGDEIKVASVKID